MPAAIGSAPPTIGKDFVGVMGALSLPNDPVFLGGTHIGQFVTDDGQVHGNWSDFEAFPLQLGP